MACANPSSNNEQELGSKIDYYKTALLGQNLEAIFREGVLIDFQYFRNKCNDIMVKELACIDMFNKSVHCVTFKPEPGSEWNKLPGFVKRTNQYITEHISGLDFFEGTYDYEMLTRFLLDACKSRSLIFAKGSEKCKFLTQFTGKQVYNLESVKNLFTPHPGVLGYFSCKEYCDQFLSCSSGHNSSAGIRYCSLNKLFRIYDLLQKLQRKQLKSGLTSLPVISPTLKTVNEEGVTSSKEESNYNITCDCISEKRCSNTCKKYISEDLYLSDSSESSDEEFDNGVDIV
jgi:hypothetical protein